MHQRTLLDLLNLNMKGVAEERCELDDRRDEGIMH